MSRLTSLFVFLPALLQLVVALTFDLGADEAHYMLYARHLDWSYFDHPPLVGWVHFLFNFVLGENLFSARLPAILLGAYSSFELFRFLREQGFAEPAARWATLAMGICFQFFVLHLFLLPDTLCLALFWPLMRFTRQVANRPGWGSWLGLGFFLGLMGLAKYTGVFFLLPIAAVVLPKQGLRILKHPAFYAAVALALFLISPVLYWNAQRDWLSFKYQGAHVLGGSNGLESFAKSVLAQLVLYSPFLWLFAFSALWGGWMRFRQKLSAPWNDSLTFFFSTALVFGLFFFVSSWKSAVLPHWPAFFYFLLIPLGVAWSIGSRPLLVRSMVGATAVVILTLVFLLTSGLGFRIPDALREVSGWREFMPQVLSRLKSENETVVVLNWTYGSRAKYYAGKDLDSRVAVLDDRFDQFDLWSPDLLEGRDLWIVQFSYDEKDLGDIVHCQTLSEKEKIPVVKRGSWIYDVILRKCEGAKPISHAGP